MIYVMREARDLYLKTNHKKEAAEAIFSSISIYLDRKQIAEAGHWLKIYEKESRNFDENGTLKKGGMYYYEKGRYLLATGQIASAIPFFKKAKDAGYKEAGYKGLMMAYEKAGISDSIAIYAKLFARANDSCYYHVNQEKVSGQCYVQLQPSAAPGRREQDESDPTEILPCICAPCRFSCYSHSRLYL